MFCPQCGQEQISDVTRFCSRCGFLLTGTVAALANGGELPQIASQPTAAKNSARRRGLMQGLFIFLLTFLVVPLVAIISKGLNITPFFVALVAISFPVGGLLRMAYAAMFESGAPINGTVDETYLAQAQRAIGREEQGALPPQRSAPASDYVFPPAGNWRDTNDLKTPASVTEETTRLLHKEQDQ